MLSELSPVSVDGRLCFTIEESQYLLKQIKLNKVLEDLQKEQNEKIEILNIQIESTKKEQRKKNIIIGASFFGGGVVIGITLTAAIVAKLLL